MAPASGWRGSARPRQPLSLRRQCADRSAAARDRLPRHACTRPRSESREAVGPARVGGFVWHVCVYTWFEYGRARQDAACSAGAANPVRGSRSRAILARVIALNPLRHRAAAQSQPFKSYRAKRAIFGPSRRRRTVLDRFGGTESARTRLLANGFARPGAINVARVCAHLSGGGERRGCRARVSGWAFVRFSGARRGRNAPARRALWICWPQYGPEPPGNGLYPH